MATNDATIIATRLTSDELEKSINELVSKVDRAMGAMAKSVDNAIGSMKGSFGQLAKNTRDSATAAKELAMGYDSVADSLTKAMSKGIGTFGGFGTKQVLESEKQALLDFNKTYHESVEKARSEQDRLNKIAEIGRLSAQQSMRPRERWDVLQDSEINRLRMTIHGLESDLKRLDNLSLRQAQQQFSEYDALIKQARSEIEKLKQTPITDPNQRTALIQQIRDYENEIKRLQAEQNKINPLSFNSEARGRLTQELQAAKNEVRQMGQALIDADNEEKKLTQGSKQYTAEIQRRAQAIRESTEWQEKGRVEIQSSANAARTYIISAKSRLSIEERLLEIQKQETAELERQKPGGIRTTDSGSREIGIKATREEIEKLIQAQRAADPVAAAMVERAYQVEASMDGGATAIGRNRQETRMTFGDYENLRAAIAAVLNVEQHRVQLVDQGIASYNKLNESLKQMTQAYQKLGSSDRSSDMGKNLASEIQKTQRAINEIQKQMTRPVSLRNALGLEEKTLDQISYKIQQLGSYMRGLDITNQRSSNEINQVTQAMNRLKQKQTEILGENARLTSSNNALARSFNYMKNRLAFYFTIGASTQFVKQLIDIRSQYEMNERALGILIGSAEHGTRIFKELSSMALVSPYTLIELSSAAKQLAAYGVAANDVVETTRRLADMAAAVGIPMERLTYALGQIQAYGYLNARDARMFANAGIPLVRELANHYTKLEGKMVSVSDIYDRIKKKAISYNDVMQVVNRMTDEGGQFFDFQAKMADTLKVQLANLNLAWNNMLNDLGQSQQGLLVGTISVLKQFFLQWKKIDALIWDLVLAFGAFKLGQFMYLLNAGVLARTEGWNILVGKKLTSSFKSLGATMKSVFTSAGTWITIAIMAVFDMIQTIKSANDAVKQFNKDLSDAGKERFDNITATLKQLNDVQKNLYTWGKDSSGKPIQTGVATINTTDAQKTWETLKELLEENSSQGEQLVGTLLKIEDVNDRLRAGFNYVKEIQAVNGAIQELGESGLKVTQNYSAFWNLWAAPDGLIKNFEDYHKTLDKVTEAEKKFGAVPVNLKDMLTVDAGRLVEDFQKLTESLQEFATSRGFNVTQEIELMQRAADKLIQDNNIDTKRAVSFRIDMEDVYVESRKKAFDDEIAYELSRQKQAQTQREKDEFAARRARVEAEKTAWLEQFNVGRTAWAEFTSWMKRNHAADIMDMFANMTNQEREHYIKTSPEFKKWAEDNAKAFTEQYGVAFDRLWKWCKDASNWTIFLNVEINANTKSLYDTLSELDKQADEAYKKLKRLRERQKEVIPQEERTLLNKEIIDNEKDYNDAIKKGGKSSAAAAEAKKAETAARKGAATATRAQRQAEDEVAKALKDELSLIKEMQSNYDKLRKAGVGNTDAINMATQGYEETIKRVNNVLSKYGINKFNASEFAGKNVKQLLDKLQKQRDDLIDSGKVKRSSLKDLEVEIQKLTIDAKSYDLKKITDGLNNELSKIKDEYEIAMELEASPELGEMIASAFDLDVSKYPKTVEEAIKRMQDETDKRIAEYMFGEGVDVDENDVMYSFDILRGDLEKWAKDTGIQVGSDLYNAISKAQEESHNLFKKDASDTISEWNKLLEKYSEYEYGKNKIIKEAEREREIARKRNASKEIFDAINTKERHDLAQWDFKWFQKSTEWSLATGRLTTLSENALGLLIDKLEQYKKSAKNLTPKQINEINKALRNLRKEMRKNNPFSVFAQSLDEARANGDLFEEEIESVGAKIESYMANYSSLSKEEKKRLSDLIERYKQLVEMQEEASKPSFMQSMRDAGIYLDKAKSIAESIKSIAESTGNQDFIDTATYIDDILGNFQAAEKGSETWGGWWGAIIGGVTDAIPKIIKYITNDKEIDESIKDLQVSVARLENQYKRLQDAIEDAYGEAEIGAKHAAIANKQLQLSNLESQLQLEKSRKKKNQDEQKIVELERQISDLKREIVEDAREITTSLLGISSVGDAAESMVSSMIEAFKNGKDWMKSYDETFESMIDNMIMKAIVGKVIGERIQKIFDYVDQIRANEDGGLSNIIAQEESKRDAMRQHMADVKSVWDEGYGRITNNKIEDMDWWKQELAELAAQEEKIRSLQNQYSSQDYITPERVEELREMINGEREATKQDFEFYAELFGLRYGQNSGKASLSALQQGIQGITEDTAGALEAYMNIVSQQVFLHSDLLTQIRDAVVMMNGDVQLATQAQMLLQLQQSYSVQMAIQAILEGWTNANGMAVRVELTN